METGGNGAFGKGVFGEHLVRDGQDYRVHLDYVHINPLKHGSVKQVSDWPYSAFRRLLERGIYPRDWAGSDFADGLGYED